MLNSRYPNRTSHPPIRGWLVFCYTLIFSAVSNDKQSHQIDSSFQLYHYIYNPLIVPKTSVAFFQKNDYLVLVKWKYFCHFPFHQYFPLL